MLPLRDTNRSSSFPVVNWAILALTGLVFLFELSLSPAALDRLFYNFGLVPSRLGLNHPAQLLAQPQPLVTLITHMFLHDGWLHILSNMWFLYIFGDNVEDRMGSGRYLVFYLLSGIIAGLVEAIFTPNEQIPAIGASGAIAGVLGAYLFMFPRARVFSVILIFIFPWFVEIPAIIFLGYWFVIQLFSGVTSLGLLETASSGGVAWWAHIGGFLFGLVFSRLFTPARQPAYPQYFPDDYPRS
jgi:membrane associated rhomboid family serine protease